jgi:glucose/mannose-6-phosphate isomerase
MILQDIKDFNKQFGYNPEIQNAGHLPRVAKKFIVCGMGGSHLAVDILKAWKPDWNITIWNDYGLPPLSEHDKKECLIIASSYSGNTEETISAFLEAKERRLPLAAVASGGELISLSKSFGVPYVALPGTGIQPRMALGFSMKAILVLMGEKGALKEVGALENLLAPTHYKTLGAKLAKQLKGGIPIIYASRRNGAIAQNWKIVINETGKIPAFSNVFPELNHNEMTGFDVKKGTKSLSSKFRFVLLHDDDDDPRIGKRMKALEGLLRARGFAVFMADIRGENRIAKIFSSVNTAQWTAFHLAKQYGVEPEQVPMVEEFKYEWIENCTKAVKRRRYG